MTRKPIDPEAPASVSPQQKNALWLFACSNTIKQVAEIMGIAEATAKEHLHRAYRGLHARNGVHAVHLAYQEGVFRSARVDKEIAALKQELAVERMRTEAAETATRDAQDELKLFSEKTRSAVLGKNLPNYPEAVRAALNTLRYTALDNVSASFIQSVLDGHPEIQTTATKWSWEDDLLRAMLCELAIRDMLGMTGAQYTDALDSSQDGTLITAFWEAHENWA